MSEEIRNAGQPEEPPKEPLQEFQDKIREIKKEQMRKKAEWVARGQRGDAHDPEFDTIDPDALGELEFTVWEKYKKGELTMEKFLELREEARKSYDAFYTEAETTGNQEKLQKHRSRSSFWAWLYNRIEE